MRKIFIRIFSCLVACALFTFSAVGTANAAAEFSVKINSASSSNRFYFSLSANGRYRIELGQRGTVGTDDSSCGSITKNSTTRYTIDKTSAGPVDCVYYYYPSSSGSDIWLDFYWLTQPTSYNTSAPAIGFYVYQRASYTNNSSYDTQKAANAAKITAISVDDTTDGSLAALFPYLGSNSGKYPLFTKTFYKATNLTTIPSTLFASNDFKYTNLTGANGMFESMFEGCTDLEYVQTQNGTGLFQYITAGGQNMFKNMFKGCSQLTTINSNFNSLQSGAAYMFDSTFMGCSQLTTVPGFSVLQSGANYMFNSTFEGCYRLPFSSISMFSALTSGAAYMFNRTFAGAGTNNSSNTLSNKIFPSTLTQGQPYMFNETFAGCSTLTLGGSGSNSLFYSITGGANYLFRNTFQGCSKLNTSLTFQVTAPYPGMFYGTFKQCTSLTSPANIFTNVSSVNGANEMFYQTYYGCSNLSSFPTSTFSKISSPAREMFYQTFNGCNALSSYIPPAFFNKLIAAGSPLPTVNNSTHNMLNGMFNANNILTACPSGYSQFITGYENYWNTSTPHKVSCDSTSNLRTVMYNCNGGSGVSGSDQTFNSALYTTRVNNCSRTGYTLKNNGAWAVGSATSTNLIAQNQTLQWTSGATTLYAQWNASSYTVTYSCGAGIANGTLPSPTATYNSSFTPLASGACTAPSNKTFAGWLVSDTSDVRPAGTAFAWTYASDKTLTAQWNATSYNISYRDGDCSSYTTLSGLSPTTYNVTQNVTLPPAPTKTGYTFNGWCDTCNCANGTTTSWTAGAKTGNQTLYAKWTANSYSINYHDSDCSSYTVLLSGLSPTTYNVTQNVTLPTPTKTGYTFNGWCDTCNCAGGYFNSWTAGSRTGIQNLFAKWTPTSYNISYRDGDCSTVLSGLSPTTYNVTQNVTLPTPTRNGYTFARWCDTCNCANGTTPSWTAGARTGNMTLFAKWTANTIELSWDGGGTPQSCTYGDTFTVPTPTSRTGYVFTGWQIDN